MDYHLATEHPDVRGSHGWLHAVPHHDDAALTVCGLPVGALSDWRILPFPDLGEPAFAHCPGCTEGVTYFRRRDPR